MAQQPKTLYLPDRLGRSRTYPVPLDWTVQDRGPLIGGDRYWDPTIENWVGVPAVVFSELDVSAFRAVIRPRL